MIRYIYIYIYIYQRSYVDVLFLISYLRTCTYITLIVYNYKFKKTCSVSTVLSPQVPSPQRLSQLSSSPNTSPYVPNRSTRDQGSTTVKRDLAPSFGSKLTTSRYSVYMYILSVVP